MRIAVFLDIHGNLAESEPLVPKKKVFEERAWFNTFKGR